MKDALIIIDMQNDVVHEMLPFAKDVVPKIGEVLNACRKAGKPVVHIVRAHRADGSDVERFRLKKFEDGPFLVEGTEGEEVIEELYPLDGEYIVKKRRFSGFFQTDLDMLLRRLKVDSVVIAGVQTPNCIRATAVDAVCLDYDVVVLSDATASATEETQSVNLKDMENMGVTVKKSDECLRVGEMT
ncbi:MAG: isochorismatase family cysteine hydrolase [Candidatus Altiarchaeota archaeon]